MENNNSFLEEKSLDDCSRMVECNHCKSQVLKSDAHPTEWKEINLIWYHCEKCVKCFLKRGGSNE